MNQEIKDETMIVVISGPSGVGKSEVIKKLLNRPPDDRHPNFYFCVSATTREPREGEVDHFNYYFTTEKHFKALVEEREFLEYASHYDHHYGTLRREVILAQTGSKIPLLDIDVEGHARLRKNPELQGKIFSIFLQPRNMEVLKQQLINRDGVEDMKKIEGRLLRAPDEMKRRSSFLILPRTIFRNRLRSDSIFIGIDPVPIMLFY